MEGGGCCWVVVNVILLGYAGMGKWKRLHAYVDQCSLNGSMHAGVLPCWSVGVWGSGRMDEPHSLLAHSLHVHCMIFFSISYNINLNKILGPFDFWIFQDRPCPFDLINPALCPTSSSNGCDNDGDDDP